MLRCRRHYNERRYHRHHNHRPSKTTMRFFKNHSKIRKAIESQRPHLFRLAFSWCHNEQLAEDLVQDTCVKALEKSEQLREVDKVAGWLTRILVNLHRDHLRREREFVDISELSLTDGGTPERHVRSENTGAHVRAVIARLGEEQRKVLTLVDLSDFTYAEVARILDIPIGTVMSRLCRARRQLRTLLEESQTGGATLIKPELRLIK